MPTASPTPIRKILILCQLGGVPGVAMLPRQLVRAGFEVAALSRRDSLLSVSRHLSLSATFGPGQTPERLWAALADFAGRWSYDIILPAEDYSARLLRVFADRLDAGTLDGPLREVIARSVVPAPHRAAAYHRSDSVAAAASLGIRVPPQTAPATADEVRAFCREWGLPVVVKDEKSMGGFGVTVADDAETAVELVRKAPERPTVQRFIDGTPASLSIACRDGELLAAFGFTALATHPTRHGAATVIRIIDEPEMVEAARRLAGHVRFTGLAGLDFMIDRAGTPWFLEMNPRMAQTAYVGAEVGCDLCAALHAGLNGSGATGPLHGTVGQTLALFPMEWQRDPDSPHLHTSRPYMPWDDPALLAAIMRRCSPTKPQQAA